jgi:long-chain acyl-CoA synthetase|tara:strand:+ start:7013 stop:8539 length:1527 start_codon:yes stop_codon:yes gene_type:complete
MNIAMYMKRSGITFSESPAIAKGTIVLRTYRELAERVSRLAFGLVNHFKLKQGEHVALTMSNCPEYLEILYACWHAGLVAVPVNEKLHQKEFAYILEHSQARVCFASPHLVETIAPLASENLKAIVDVSAHHYQQLLKCDPLPMVSREPHDSAWLFYTSGTTGKPKGAILTHRNLLASSFCYFTDVDQGSPWRAILHVAPMSHGSGVYALAHVMQASCHVIPETGRFDVDEIYHLIESWPAVVFFGAPTMVKRMLDYPGDTDTTNLKTIIYGGGPMYLEDCLAGLERFGPKLAQLYGQGESPMTITALSSRIHADKDDPRWRQRLASVGTPQSAVQVGVANTEDIWLPAGEVGEVLVRGESVMSGYWCDPESTKEVLRNGWLHTGDCGYFDEEGFLTLKDRSKDLIISGGTNIYPREVEEVLIRCPGVSEVAVIGRPDREWGETVVAYLVTSKDQTVDEASINNFCIENMARFKRPKFYRKIDSLPKNNYGKVLKTKLREMELENENK